MKKVNHLLFVILTMFIVLGSNAQDKIILKTGTNIEAKVLEINQTTVRYKKFNNLEGPTFVSDKNEIHMITYENGVNEVFDNNYQDGGNESDYSAKKSKTKFGKNRFENSFAIVGYNNSLNDYDSDSFGSFNNAISYERILDDSGLLGLKFRGDFGFTEYDEIIMSLGVSFNVYPFKNAKCLYVGPSIKYGAVILYDEYDYYYDNESVPYFGLGLVLGCQFQISRLFGIRSGFEFYQIQIDNSSFGEMGEIQYQVGFNFSF